MGGSDPYAYDIGGNMGGSDPYAYDIGGKKDAKNKLSKKQRD